MTIQLRVTDLHRTGDGSRPCGFCPRERRAVLAPHRDRLLFIGHGRSHRTCFGQWLGIPVIGQRSLVQQASLGLRRNTRLVEGTPAFSVIEIEGEGLWIHHETLDGGGARVVSAGNGGH